MVKKEKGVQKKKYKVVLADQMKLGKVGQHLVCADLLSMGFDAFFAGEGLGYDVIVDLGSCVKRIQVKTTSERKDAGKSKAIYRFYLKTGKGARKTYKPQAFDLCAFVCLDSGKIAYIRTEDLMSAITGDIIQGIDFTTAGYDRHLLRKPKHETRVLEGFTFLRAIGGNYG